jgi:hypothetical protein
LLDCILDASARSISQNESMDWRGICSWNFLTTFLDNRKSLDLVAIVCDTRTSYRISFYYSQNETKAAVVERVIRTLKSSLHRYFRHEQTYRYLDILQKFVSDYNNRTHRSLGQFSHADVNEANADEVRYSSYLARTYTLPLRFRNLWIDKRGSYHGRIVVLSWIFPPVISVDNLVETVFCRA